MEAARESKRTEFKPHLTSPSQVTLGYFASCASVSSSEAWGRYLHPSRIPVRRSQMVCVSGGQGQALSEAGRVSGQHSRVQQRGAP